MKIKASPKQFFAMNMGKIFFCIIALLCMSIPNKYISIFASLCFLIFSALLFYKYIKMRSIIWDIGNEVICVQRGIISQTKDYIELYRVVDYRERQTAMQRIFGLKSIVIISRDATDSFIMVFGIPTKNDLIKYVRENVEKCRKNKNVYEISNNH